jgi:hypothetical protein
MSIILKVRRFLNTIFKIFTSIKQNNQFYIFYYFTMNNVIFKKKQTKKDTRFILTHENLNHLTTIKRQTDRQVHNFYDLEKIKKNVIKKKQLKN